MDTLRNRLTQNRLAEWHRDWLIIGNVWVVVILVVATLVWLLFALRFFDGSRIVSLTERINEYDMQKTDILPQVQEALDEEGTLRSFSEIERAALYNETLELNSLRRSVVEFARQPTVYPHVVTVFSGVVLCVIWAVGLGSWLYTATRIWRQGRISAWEASEDTWIKNLDDGFLKTNKKESAATILLARKNTQHLHLELDKLYRMRVLTVPAATPRWEGVAKLFYKIGFQCRELEKHGIPANITPDKISDTKNAAHEQYENARKLYRLNGRRAYFEPVIRLLSILIPLALLGYTAVQILDRDRSFGRWLAAIFIIIFGILIAYTVFRFLQFLVRYFTERTWTDLDDILVSVVSTPFAAATFLLFLYQAYRIQPSYVPLYLGIAWDALMATTLTQILTILLLTWVVIQIFDKFIVQLLKQWAEKTHQKYDDMFVKILQIFGTFIIVATALGIILVNFQAPIREATGVDNVLLPYSIVVSVFSAILGFASREAVENFFGGVLLQIDKPFDIGERLIMETGEVCDVREVGMRSTVLYNVLENTLLSIPNTIMSNRMITNVSRPDIELRIRLRLHIPQDAKQAYLLRKAERILLDLAYLEVEVDRMRITPIEKEEEESNRPPRRSLEEEVLSLLKMHYRELKDAAVYRLAGSGSRANKQKIFADNDVKEENVATLTGLNASVGIGRTLGRIKSKRGEYRKKVKEVETLIKGCVLKQESASLEKLELSARIQLWYQLLRECAYQVICVQEDADTVLEELAFREEIFRDESGQVNFDKLKSFIASLSNFIYLSFHQNQLPNLRNDSNDSTVEDHLFNISRWLKMEDTQRYGIIEDIADNYHVLSEYIYAIADQSRQVRPFMDVLIGELSKEPTVHSEFKITEDGRGYLEIIFNVFTLYLERRYEVYHKLNTTIHERFSFEGIDLSRVELLPESQPKSLGV